MPSPHPAVTPAAIEIAKAYSNGKSVSKGIIAMDKRIKELEIEIARMGAWIEERV